MSQHQTVAGPRRRTALRRVIAIGLALTAASSCRESTAPPGTEGVRAVAGANVADTIFAPLARPLVVQVRDENGAPAANVVVRFDATRATAPPLNPFGVHDAWSLTIRSTPTPPGAPFGDLTVFDTTDARGEASVYVTLGYVAGPAWVAVEVPALGLTGRADYVVRAGQAVAVAALPRDTALYVGAAYSLRGVTVDRMGNSRNDPVTYSAAPTHATLKGAAVTGTSIGRDRFVVAAGSWRDTAWVSVVPHGHLAAIRRRPTADEATRLMDFELDGSLARAADLSTYTDAHPDWLPGGNDVVLEQAGDWTLGESHLFVMPAGGGTARRLVPAALGLQRELFPQVSVDGQWIYFAGGVPNLQDHTEIWRIHPDGSGAERVGEPASAYAGDTYPSPSPAGDAVIFGTDRFGCCYSYFLRVRYLDTGVVDSLWRGSGVPTPGQTPRWSPNDASRVAYLSQDYVQTGTFADIIWLMRPDGSDRRALTSSSSDYAGGFDWSPDGKWIVARNELEDRLDLIEVATGLTLPLGYSRGLSAPSWRP